MPAKAVDCHAHIFPPDFPLPAGPGHKPEPYQRVTRQDHAAMLARHGLTHGVLSQPSGYQFDNRAMLDAMAHGGGRIKGIANVPYDSDDATLDALERQGVVGQRSTSLTSIPASWPGREARRFLDRLRERGWWAEIHAHGPWYADLMPILSRGHKLILCHMGRPQIDLGVDRARLSECAGTGPERAGGGQVHRHQAVLGASPCRMPTPILSLRRCWRRSRRRAASGARTGRMC